MKFIKKLSVLICATLLLSTNSSFAQAKVINKGNPEFSEIALTFDDGYSVEKIRKIMDKLRKHNVKGTFFFVGSFIANNKEIIVELEKEGHLVVNHSFSHPDFKKISDKRIVGEMENTKIAYNKATNKKMLPYFRLPYGSYDDRVLSVMGKNHDLYVVMWSIDTLDWKGLSAETISNKVLSNASNGDIVLMHTTQHVNTDKALDNMISGLKKKGFSFVTIDEMISKLPPEKQLSKIEKNLEALKAQNNAKTPPIQPKKTEKLKTEDIKSEKQNISEEQNTNKEQSTEEDNIKDKKNKSTSSKNNSRNKYIYRFYNSR